MPKNDDLKQVDGDAGVASQGDNQKLEHSQGGRSSRDDVLDLGVPMLPGDPSERQGPEDALGAGPTRGDYRNRIGDAHYHPHQTLPVEDAEPGEPNVRVVAQRQLAEEIGDVKGLKGGVDTHEGQT